MSFDGLWPVACCRAATGGASGCSGLTGGLSGQ